MEGRITLSIVTAEGAGETVKCDYVNLPTEFGSVGILANHAPMYCAVAAGRIAYRLGDGEMQYIPTGAGIATVENNEITVLCRR